MGCYKGFEKHDSQVSYGSQVSKGFVNLYLVQGHLPLVPGGSLLYDIPR